MFQHCFVHFSIAKNTDGTLSSPPGLSMHSLQKLLSDAHENVEIPENIEIIKVSKALD